MDGIQSLADYKLGVGRSSVVVVESLDMVTVVRAPVLDFRLSNQRVANVGLAV